MDRAKLLFLPQLRLMEADCERQMTCPFSEVVLCASSTGHLIPCEAIITRTLKCMVSDAPESPLVIDSNGCSRVLENDVESSPEPEETPNELNDSLGSADWVSPGLRKSFLVRANMPLLELLTSPDKMLVEST